MKIKAIIPAVVIVSTLAVPAFAQTNGLVLQGARSPKLPKRHIASRVATSITS
jgi:hypothetical protein